MYFIIPFSYQNLSTIHAFVLHTKGLKVDADYIPKLGFSSWDFGSKYHNLYSLMRPFVRTPSNGRYRQVWLLAVSSIEYPGKITHLSQATKHLYSWKFSIYDEIVVYLKWRSIHAMFHDSSWISIRTQSTINCHTLLKIHTYFSPRKWIEVSCSTVEYWYCTRFKHCCMPCHCYHHVDWDIYWYNVSYSQRITLHWP